MSVLTTTRIVADHFGVHPETVRIWVRKGIVPYFRPTARTIRFDLNEVERALRYLKKTTKKGVCSDAYENKKS
jgi:DNA-binding transcriptional MerR regulator